MSKESFEIIPPLSLVKIARVTKNEPAWKNHLGRIFRIGYYRRNDGLIQFLPAVVPRLEAGRPVFQRRLGPSPAASGILDRPARPGDDTEWVTQFEYASRMPKNTAPPRG